MLILLFVVLCLADGLPHGDSRLTSPFWHFALVSLSCCSVSYACVLAGLMPGGLPGPAAVISHSTWVGGFLNLCLCHSCCYSFTVCYMKVYSVNYSFMLGT